MSLYAIGDLHLHFQAELKAPLWSAAAGLLRKANLPGIAARRSYLFSRKMRAMTRKPA